MKELVRLEASIDRYQRGFWNRQAVDRPPLLVQPDRAWLPMNYLRAPLSTGEFQPQDISGELVRTDYEDAALHRAVTIDDWMPWSAAWRAVPWLEAISGCSVFAAQGSLAPGPWARTFDDLEHLEEHRSQAWFDRLGELTAELVATAPADCFISPSIWRGPADVLAAGRDLTTFYLDLFDEPERLAAAAMAVTDQHIEVLGRHFSKVDPHALGGYGHIYGYWSPGPTTVIQDDVLGMCAPATFREIFLPPAAKVVESVGPNVLFHLHSTGFAHYRDVLDIPGLGGVQITVEPIGPTLEAMLPALREILERSRLLLMIDSHFDELVPLLRQLPTDGLCVTVNDRFVSSDDAFRDLVSAAWPGCNLD